MMENVSKCESDIIGKIKLKRETFHDQIYKLITEEKQLTWFFVDK